MKILQYIRLHIKNSITQIAHLNTFHPLRYAPLICVKCLFTNIQKQQNTLKAAYFLRKIQTSRANNSRILRIQNAKFSYCFYMKQTYGEIFKSALVYLKLYLLKIYETPTQVFSYESCEILKNTYFKWCLQMAASDHIKTVNWFLYNGNIRFAMVYIKGSWKLRLLRKHKNVTLCNILKWWI